MPLLAIDTHRGDEVIDLTADDAGIWSEIWRKSTGDRLRCRSCRQPVHAKQRSESGLRFFAHTVVVPDCPSQGESTRHLHLKGMFVRAFRAAGWSAELEFSGEGWRTDVLATDPTGARVAVEVQVSPIVGDEVDERTSRHRASGLRTVWVVSGNRRPVWAKARPTILVDSSDYVVDTVRIPSESNGVPGWAGPASINRFIQRWTEGRLSPIVTDHLTQLTGYDDSPAAAVFQLDRCIDNYIAEKLSQQQQRGELEARRLAERAPVNALMANSLHAFVDWFEPWQQRVGYHAWFRGGGRVRDALEAAQSDWDHDVGIIILIGRDKPTHVLALAEPRRRMTTADPRVLAWTNGQDPATDVTGFPKVLTPASDPDELPWLSNSGLKPFRPKRRWY